ncbi:putative 2-aminoethylphosphonate ABC transporter substrate-binding protein [Paenibacillus shunpengii]|uniref:2-aminoethylphosphonate ABC transporter substrate-binding protein n=1 Tax=Paenibacillus shunpengii TaxID=2054424 RepID=A0ABW5SJX5_9BACL|nr:putative 2-aminoethylphosphonate ABC transporter substrate-binding protein [Paenibacillus sp. PDC88]SDX45334.1 iron(III) transport system substrate-binding protein [Paenibacillus sp. PDC88]
MKKDAMLLICLLLISALLAACGTNGSGAGEGSSAQAGSGSGEEELTVYTALEDDLIEAYLASYREKYPNVKLNIVRDSTGVITAKLLAEKDNPQADVVWGVAATSLLVLDEQGMLAPYSPAGIERIQPEFKDEAEPARWVGIDAWETAFIVNTIEMENRGLAVPQTYEDLLKPEYKGMITMPNPASSGTGFLTVSGLTQLLGEEEAWSYMDKLHDNVGVYTHSGSKPAKMAGTGEYPIGISFGYRGIVEKNEGSPVEVVFPSEGSGWDVEANALIQKEHVKQTAKDFLDWAIADEAMTEYAKNYPITAVKNESGAIPEGYTQDPMNQLIEYNLEEAASQRDEVLAEWSSRYEGKSEAE